ncbi:MAG: class I SAM-dependent methyltransferase, partial [Oscillospiraceae bacterium]|nr:class I SAM-dependent methyltransferase [Oscillospiraceae bacterium]
MLDSRGFDLWADGYDAEVGFSDEDGSYPFAGYKAVLGEIYRVIMEKPGTSVLDLGFGTGTLTSKLYEGGHEIYGQDFSKRMLEIASEKMPEAHLYAGDLAEGLAPELLSERYDFITATYSLHHLTDGRKVSLIRQLMDLLNEGGMILIGDVAFGTRDEMDACRIRAGEEWDKEEIYIVASELRKEFPELTFEARSFCAGVLTLKKEDGIRTEVIKEGDSLWEAAAEYASGVSWRAGPYLANMMRTGQFRDWERVIIAREGDEILGFCDFTEFDDMPQEKGYSPFIGFVFVGEEHRGR